MSISAMTRNAAMADVEASSGTSPAMPGRAVQASENKNALADALEKVAAYIPSETIAAYVPAIGIANTDTYWIRWSLLLAGVLLTWFLVWINSAARRTAAQKRKYGRILLLAVVSFILWAMALPNTPFAQFLGSAAPRVGGVAVLFLTPVFVALAKRWNLRPSA